MLSCAVRGVMLAQRPSRTLGGGVWSYLCNDEACSLRAISDAEDHMR